MRGSSLKALSQKDNGMNELSTKAQHTPSFIVVGKQQSPIARQSDAKVGHNKDRTSKLSSASRRSNQKESQDMNLVEDSIFSTEAKKTQQIGAMRAHTASGSIDELYDSSSL